MHDLGYVSIALEAFFILRGNSGSFSQGVYTGSHNFEWLTTCKMLHQARLSFRIKTLKLSGGKNIGIATGVLDCCGIAFDSALP